VVEREVEREVEETEVEETESTHSA